MNKFSRFTSSLKPSTKPSKLEKKHGKREAQPDLRVPNRQKWHEKMRGCEDILEYLFNGGPSIDENRARSLSQPTTEFLIAADPGMARPSAESDQVLSNLLNEHARNDPSTSCIAVLSCLPDLSLPTATKYIISLHKLEIRSYLRCIIVASQMKPGLIPAEELQAAKLLLLISSGQAQGLQEFGKLVQSLAFDGTAVYVPVEFVHNALVQFWPLSFLQSQIQTHLDQHQFMTAFGLISWLQEVTRNPGNSNVLSFLNFHFHCWPWLSIWTPNVDRINTWEHGKITKAQREKLSNIFKLDGPDYNTQAQSSLRLAEPQCYEHVEIEPASPESLERFLNLLYKACLNGPRSIDLFIQQCVGKPVSPDVLSIVERAVCMGEDDLCASLLTLTRTLEPQSDLTHTVCGLTELVLILDNSDILDDYQPLVNQIPHRLCNTMQLAQDEFCKQLRSGPGDYIGVLIHKFGAAILQSPRVSSRLPPEFLQNIKQFPRGDTLEAIFDELQDDSENLAPHSFRLKKYLASSLGGKGISTAEPVTMVNIQAEITFWKHPPDILRKSFAKKLENIQGLDYTVYTKCLHAMLKEHDLYLTEMNCIIVPDDERAGFKFASYLAYRQGFDQLKNECWLFVMVSLLKSHKASSLPKISDSISFMEWNKWIGDLRQLLVPIHNQIPESGPGLTRERMAWWKILSQNVSAVQLLLEMNGQQRSLQWLYFPASPDHVMRLLQTASQGTTISPLNRQIISYLTRNGSNTIQVSDCIQLTSGISMLGNGICKRFLSTGYVTRWSEPELCIVFAAWSKHKSLTPADRAALESIRSLLGLPFFTDLDAADVHSMFITLRSEYDTIFRKAKELESFRLKLQHQNPQRLSAMLSHIGIENVTSGRIINDIIPNELVDAIDEVGDNEYELSFPLTSLSTLQRQGRGIHKNSRMLLVRLSLRGNPQFCIHFSPDNEGQIQHIYWQPIDSQEPPTMSCTTKSNLFTYYIGRNLHYMLKNGQPGMKSIYNSIQTLITAHPTTCLVCCTDIGTKLWKPAACSVNCSRKLRQAPLEVRLHNLLVDPITFDLLLTCVYAAAADTSGLDLLPNCPVQKHRVTAVIDSLPALLRLQNASNLKTAIQGSDGLGKEREDLLSWLCLSFRGFILSAQSSFRVPSMPNTHQFLLLNNNHEIEGLFNAQAPTRGSGRVVFHGTRISRLFLILTQGLKVMSGTQFMLNGAAQGPGIYCGDDQLTSLGYSGGTGPSWKNSVLGNMKILLGCELATPGPSALGNYHVVVDQSSLLVRYIFLLPANYQPPPRHHVEPAMTTTYTSLRSGSLM